YVLTSHPYSTLFPYTTLFRSKRAKTLSEIADILVIDVAHFHNANVFSATKKILEEVDTDVIVGSIGTYKAAEDILTKLDGVAGLDRKSTRLNSSHVSISYAVF